MKNLLVFAGVFTAKHLLAVLLGTLVLGLFSTFARDWTDNDVFSYQMETSMKNMECAMYGYTDDIRCTIYLRNK